MLWLKNSVSETKNKTTKLSLHTCIHTVESIYNRVHQTDKEFLNLKTKKRKKKKKEGPGSTFKTYGIPLSEQMFEL